MSKSADQSVRNKANKTGQTWQDASRKSANPRKEAKPSTPKRSYCRWKPERKKLSKPCNHSLKQFKRSVEDLLTRTNDAHRRADLILANVNVVLDVLNAQDENGKAA